MVKIPCTNRSLLLIIKLDIINKRSVYFNKKIVTPTIVIVCCIVVVVVCVLFVVNLFVVKI